MSENSRAPTNTPTRNHVVELIVAALTLFEEAVTLIVANVMSEQRPLHISISQEMFDGGGAGYDGVSGVVTGDGHTGQSEGDDDGVSMATGLGLLVLEDGVLFRLDVSIGVGIVLDAGTVPGLGTTTTTLGDGIGIGLGACVGVVVCSFEQLH